MYAEYARVACDWFSGNNLREAHLIDESTGGCFDAICAKGIDPNQGGTAAVAAMLAFAVVNGPVAATQDTPIEARV